MGDLISDALSNLMNCERVGKKEVFLKPVSNLLKKIITLLKDHGYVGDWEFIENGRGGIIRVKLLGKINKVGSIRPRFSVKKDGFEKFEKRYLPAAGFGLLLVSTSAGVMTHVEAKKRGLGGKLLAYVY